MPLPSNTSGTSSNVGDHARSTVPPVLPGTTAFSTTPAQDQDYATFKKNVTRLCGVDLDCYKDAQMQRRILSLAGRHGFTSLGDYYTLLTRDGQRLIEFKDFITINVSEFFRNPTSFAALGQKHLPELLKKHPSLTIWSAGCSIGAEPYSIAMILSELAPQGLHKILATDIDDRILDRARAGTNYLESDIKAMDPVMRKKYMTPNATGGFDVSPTLKKWITFKKHNLLADPFPTQCDLIVCRNVVIYFKEEAKDLLYQRFTASLRPDGILFVGGTEILRSPQDCGLVAAGTSFYRKAA